MDEDLKNKRLDKNVLSISSLSDQSDDKKYWLSRTPIERTEQIELLRRINYGHAASARLQRVLEIVEGLDDFENLP